MSVQLPGHFLSASRSDDEEKATHPSIVLSKDQNGINLGCFAVRGGDKWAYTVLERAWQQRQFTNHPWWEQAAVAFVLYGSNLMPRVNEHVDVVPQRTLNSYPHNWLPGDWMVHFAGTRNTAALGKLFVAFQRKCLLVSEAV